ncbi:MAG: acyl-CoA dehydrogenase family protein [Gammaproteobacteria bacterium]
MKHEAVPLDEFRAQARAWIRANLERLPVERVHGVRMRNPSSAEIASARRLQRRLFEAGFAGISYPIEYGGRGLTSAHERVFKEESAGYVTPDFGGAGVVTFGPVGRSILAHGSAALKKSHLPAILAGEEIWCQFYSEPDAGSDLAGIRTSAVLNGERYLLNGSKIWSTGAYYADWAMCLARTDWSVPKHRGLTWFVLPTRAPGVTVKRIAQIDGSAEFCEEFLDDVPVPVTDVLGEVGRGWEVTQTMLVYERGAGASGASAEPRAVAPDLVALAAQVGRLRDPLARQAIARAHILDWAQYHLGARIAARLSSPDRPAPAIAAYAKLAMGTFRPIRARQAVAIGGSRVLSWKPGDEAARAPAIDYLNGRMASIAAGTNEMQRNGIGERVLGLPREPSFDQDKPFAQVLRDARHWDGKIG